jgi:hypothetical protein
VFTALGSSCTFSHWPERRGGEEEEEEKKKEILCI